MRKKLELMELINRIIAFKKKAMKESRMTDAVELQQIEKKLKNKIDGESEV